VFNRKYWPLNSIRVPHKSPVLTRLSALRWIFYLVLFVSTLHVSTLPLGRQLIRSSHSIISMNDRSLPSRACPTCKNKYHANCLFTWFKSSNSSTCPMCRSLF
jgi:hypothetical protein